MLLSKARFKIVADEAGHCCPIGSLVTFRSLNSGYLACKPDEGAYTGTTRNFTPNELELIAPGKEEPVEDPKLRKIRLLKAQALILARVEGVSNLEESKITRLVSFYVEALTQKIHPKMAMKAVVALAKVIA